MENRRKIKYVDKNIQGYLMMLLIILDVTMVIAAMLYLYFSFNSIFEESIYLIHQSAHKPFYIKFIFEMVKVVVVMSLINVIALFIANRIWINYIKKIINYLNSTMNCVKHLSVKFPPANDVPTHDLSDQIARWQRHEVTRANNIHAIIDNLPQPSEKLNTDALTKAIAELHLQLQFTTKGK